MRYGTEIKAIKITSNYTPKSKAIIGNLREVTAKFDEHKTIATYLS